MKPEDQRVAIHQALGYKLTETFMGIYWKKPGETLALSDFMRGATTPDYLRDLNAMHEAEKVLTPIQCNDYDTRIVHALRQAEAFPAANKWKFHAIAAQRAEAFLRTLGLWTD